MSLVTAIPTAVIDTGIILTQGRIVAGVIRSGTLAYDVKYPEYARWLYVGTTGNLSYVKWDGSTETLPNLTGGQWHYIYSIQINSSGTTIAANQLRWGS